MIYSDRCSVEKEPAGQQIWAFCTPSGKWDQVCIRHVKHRQVEFDGCGVASGEINGAHKFLVNGTHAAGSFLSLGTWALPFETMSMVSVSSLTHRSPLTLNPIGHAWVPLKRQLLTLVTYPGGTEEVKSRLALAVGRIFLQSSSRLCDSLCRTGFRQSSMQKGWHNSLLARSAALLVLFYALSYGNFFNVSK